MSDLEHLMAALRNSQMLRVSLVALLTLVLLIPIAMIGGLVSDREQRYQEAIAEVSEKWGSPQLVSGPALVVPYIVEETIPSEDQTAGVVTRTRHAVFLPTRLQVTGQIETEARARGIFRVPVYTAAAAVEGTFARPDPAGLGIDPASIDWSRARLVVGISDVRAIAGGATLTWNGVVSRFLPGTTGFGERSGVQAPIPVGAGDRDADFAFSLSLNGSGSLYWVPFAEETSVHVSSNSPYPSFQGHWLPTDRTVSGNGFEATWQVSWLGRNYPQAWTSLSDPGPAIEESQFGVALGTPTDLYRMAERSVKYAGLFVLLTFATVWLMEVLGGVRVHPIQYLTLGAALCVFYLLELSLAEHLGFPRAYGIASLSILAMVVAYGHTVFGSWRRAGWAASSVGMLYVYLFVLLTNEDSALLFGSVGLFLVLAAIMFATRHIDWYAGAGVDEGQPVHPGDAKT